MWNDWQNFTAHRASSKSHASTVPTQNPLQPTWGCLLVEGGLKGLFCISLPNRTQPGTAVNIQARCQVFFSFCPPAYKHFLQLSLLTTSIFLICSDVLLPPRWEVQGVSILSIYCFAHSATVESKNQDHETCLQQNRQLVCHKMWKYTTKVCSNNTYIQLKQIPLWSF